MTSEQPILAIFSLLVTALLCFPAPAFAEKASMGAAPKLNLSRAGEFAAARREITGGPWSLGQAWRVEPVNGLRCGTVRFGWDPDALWVLAELPDDYIITRSTGHDQRMWELGDVFEIFVQRQHSRYYLELHVTPKNHRLLLQWTKTGLAEVSAKRRLLEEFQRPGDLFESWVRVRKNPNRWQLLVRLPAAVLPGGSPFQPRQKLSVSFSRYDAGRKGTASILSSTSPHRKLDFHRRHEWRSVVLEP